MASDKAVKHNSGVAVTLFFADNGLQGHALQSATACAPLSQESNSGK
jgi:hypothetical protein